MSTVSTQATPSVAQPAVQRATILLAHGSRDPLWRRPVEAVAQRMSELAPTLHVRCAYLESCTPDLPSCAAELAGLGVRSITVAPLFFGLGKHLRDDLPRLLSALQSDHPGIDFDLRKSIGEEVRLIELLAQLAVS